MQPSSYARHYVPTGIIQHAIRLNLHFTSGGCIKNILGTSIASTSGRCDQSRQQVYGIQIVSVVQSTVYLFWWVLECELIPAAKLKSAGCSTTRLTEGPAQADSPFDTDVHLEMLECRLACTARRAPARLTSPDRMSPVGPPDYHTSALAWYAAHQGAMVVSKQYLLEQRHMHFRASKHPD
jgi:hypothetical protein